jgi:putative addiction module component (TIGR02574 family)
LSNQLSVAAAVAERDLEGARVSKAAFDINQLSPEERLDLIEKLWDSLSDDDAPLTDVQRRELDDRRDALDREGSVGLPWEHVFRGIA